MDYQCTLLGVNDLKVMKAYPVRFAIRFHPRTEPKLKSETLGILKRNGIETVDFDDSNAEAFLAQIGGLITGTSSLALDAAYQGVPTFVLRNKSDYYGFIQRSLFRT